MSERRLILVIDDDSSIVKGIQLRLQRAGFDTITAYNGRAAVPSWPLQKLPDLVVMDCQMPVVDGFGAMALMNQHADASGIPVIMVSGEESSRDRRWQPEQPRFCPSRSMARNY